MCRMQEHKLYSTEHLLHSLRRFILIPTFSILLILRWISCEWLSVIDHDSSPNRVPQFILPRLFDTNPPAILVLKRAFELWSWVGLAWYGTVHSKRGSWGLWYIPPTEFFQRSRAVWWLSCSSRVGFGLNTRCFCLSSWPFLSDGKCWDFKN